MKRSLEFKFLYPSTPHFNIDKPKFHTNLYHVTYLISCMM